MGTHARHAVLDLARARLAEMARDTVTAVQQAIPAYRGLHDDQLRDMTAIASWAIVRLLEAWTAESGGLDEQDLARFRAIGAARAEDGRPLAAVLRSYRVAAAVATDAVIDLGGDRLDVADLRALTRVVLAFTDELSEAITAGYGAARDRLTGDRSRALRELLDDLLIGRQSSAGALADRSRELGLALPGTALVLVVEPTDPTLVVGLPALATLLAGLGLSDTGPEHLATLHGRRAVLVLPDRLAPGAEPAVRGRHWRGCAIRRQPVQELAAGFHLAAHALEVAPAHAFSSTRALLDEGDAHLLALLAARPTTRPEDVVRTVLGRLVDPGQAHLLAGLGAYLSTGSATDAAALLHLHPQTLRYRLRRSVELTGRDPRDPWHRLALDVAHQLARSGTRGARTSDS